eukprot:TRINITY_DN12636_c0_g1_i2.p1 TRINITY_DN12636_c0_g1~~TRINITY_DN12636_c0_g1_i2.p1  ORF type:complete len:273 (-),score=43.07 TRINITY_DN12636_c0_g1_i2:81-899(-)
MEAVEQPPVEGKKKGRKRKTNPKEGEEADVKPKEKKNHNLIEQKRRQKINEKIEELKQIVPQFANQNKAAVLEGTIESIRSLRKLCSKLLAQHRTLQEEYTTLMAEHGKFVNPNVEEDVRPVPDPSSTLTTPNGSPPFKEEEVQSTPVNTDTPIHLPDPTIPHLRTISPLTLPPPTTLLQHPSGPIPSFPSDSTISNPLYPNTRNRNNHPSDWASHHPPSLLNSNNESFLKEYPFLQRLVHATTNHPPPLIPSPVGHTSVPTHSLPPLSLLP